MQNNKGINTEYDSNLEKQLDLLRSHLDEVVQMSKSFRITADLSPSFEKFVRTCQEVRNRLHIHEQSRNKKADSNDQLQKFINQISGAESLAKECKNKGVLSDGIDSFIKACQRIKMNIEGIPQESKEGSINNKEESNTSEKSQSDNASASNTDSSFLGSIKNFLSAYKFFKIKVDDFNGKSNSKTKNSNSKDPLTQVILKLNETEKLAKEGKKKGYVMSNNAEEFIKSCEKIKKQLKKENGKIKRKRHSELTNMKPAVEVSNNNVPHASSIIEVVDKLNLVGLISDSIENYLRSQLIAKGCIDVATCDAYCVRKDAATNTKTENASTATCTDNQDFVISSERFLNTEDIRKSCELNEVEYNERNGIFLKGQTFDNSCKCTVLPTSKSTHSHQMVDLLPSPSCRVCVQTNQKTKLPQAFPNCCKLTSFMNLDKKDDLEELSRPAPVICDKCNGKIETIQMKNEVPCNWHVCDCVKDPTKFEPTIKPLSNVSLVKTCDTRIAQIENDQKEIQRLLTSICPPSTNLDQIDVIKLVKNIVEPTQDNEPIFPPPKDVNREDSSPPTVVPIKKPLSKVLSSVKTCDTCIAQKKIDQVVQNLAPKLLTNICPPNNLEQVDVIKALQNKLEPTQENESKVSPPNDVNKEEPSSPTFEPIKKPLRNLSPSVKTCDTCVAQKKNDQVVQHLAQRLLTSICPPNKNLDQIDVMQSLKNIVQPTQENETKICPPKDVKREKQAPPMIEPIIKPLCNAPSSAKICGNCIGQSKNDQLVEQLTQKLLTGIRPPKSNLEQIDVIKSLIVCPPNDINRKESSPQIIEPIKKPLSSASPSVKIYGNCIGQRKNDPLMEQMAQKLLTGICPPSINIEETDGKKAPKNIIELTDDNDSHVCSPNAANQEDPSRKSTSFALISQPKVLKNTFDDEKPESSHCQTLKKMEPRILRPDCRELSDIDNSLGLFEKKLRKIIRVTRTLDVDGKVRETTEVLIQEGSRHESQISEMDSDDFMNDNTSGPLEKITTTFEKVVKHPNEL